MTDTCRRIWEKTDHDLCLPDEPVPSELYEENSGLVGAQHVPGCHLCFSERTICDN